MFQIVYMAAALFVENEVKLQNRFVQAEETKNTRTSSQAVR